MPVSSEVVIREDNDDDDVGDDTDDEERDASSSSIRLSDCSFSSISNGVSVSVSSSNNVRWRLLLRSG